MLKTKKKFLLIVVIALISMLLSGAGLLFSAKNIDSEMPNVAFGVEVQLEGGVYVVEKHDLAFNPTGDPGTGESGGSCSCSAWTQKSNTVYRTNSDATCTGSQYSTNSSGCYTYKIVGTGEISNTASGHWFCKAKIYTRTCTK